MRKIIYQLAKSIVSALEKPKPPIHPLKVSYDKVLLSVDNLKLWKLYPALLDHFQDYYYVPAEEWADIFNWIYFEFDMPSYLKARTDCEDFAILLKGLVGAYFGLNYFGVVIGTTPAGGHAWNLFMTEDGWLQFEPQTGDCFEIGAKAKGYVPTSILI